MRNLRNLDVGTQSQDPENVQRNLEIMQIPRLREHYTWHWGTLWPVLAVMLGWVAPLVHIGDSINWTQIYWRNLSSKVGRGNSERFFFFSCSSLQQKTCFRNFKNYEVLALSMPDKRSKLEVFTLLLG